MRITLIIFSIYLFISILLLSAINHVASSDTGRDKLMEKIAETLRQDDADILKLKASGDACIVLDDESVICTEEGFGEAAELILETENSKLWEI